MSGFLRPIPILKKEEIVKDIAGYEGRYAITTLGRVWSYKSSKWLKQRPDSWGYFILNLFKNGNLKTYRTNRLVAENFILPGQKNHRSLAGDMNGTYFLTF